MLTPLTLGLRVRLDLCLSPQPTMSTWAGPLDSRLGQAGVPNGFLHSMEVRVDGQCFALTVVLVQGRMFNRRQGFEGTERVQRRADDRDRRSPVPGPVPFTCRLIVFLHWWESISVTPVYPVDHSCMSWGL